MYLFVVLTFSCGLPEPVFLQPPEVSYVREPESNEYDLLFKNSSNSKNIFMGYELYYKIYDPVNADALKYDTEKKAIEDSSLTGKTALTNYGYKRMFFSNVLPESVTFKHDTNMPSFKIESSLINLDFQIRLLFRQNNENNTDSFFASTFNTDYSFSQNPYFYRYIDNAEGNIFGKAKLFDTDDFDLNDNDMPSTVTLSNYENTDNLYISFYIMSYGVDQSNLKDVYSKPEYLGTLKFEVDITDIENNIF